MRQEEFNVACEEYLGELAGQANVQLMQDKLILMRNSRVGMLYHLDRLYEEFSKRDCELQEFLQKAFEQYDEDVPEEIEGFAKKFKDFEYAKKHLSVRVLPYKPENAVAEKFLDLWVVAYLDLGKTGDQYKSAVIPTGLAECWGFKEKEYHLLIQASILNMQNCEVIPMSAILMEFGFGPDNFKYPFKMYVVTSEARVYGAGYLANLEELARIAKVLNGSYYVIPSSIHELLVIPAADIEEEFEQEEIIPHFKEMINEVNNSCLEERDKLSDHLYFYNAERNEVLSLE